MFTRGEKVFCIDTIKYPNLKPYQMFTIVEISKGYGGRGWNFLYFKEDIDKFPKIISYRSDCFISVVEYRKLKLKKLNKNEKK